MNQNKEPYRYVCGKEFEEMVEMAFRDYGEGWPEGRQRYGPLIKECIRVKEMRNWWTCLLAGVS
jgi:hypothetical protein